MRQAGRLASAAALSLSISLSLSAAQAAEPPLAAVTIVGPAEVVFNPKRDACDGDDMPDTSARAFRDAEGAVAVFAMHTKNRALRGPDFASLKIDCRSPLPSNGSAEPGAYDDASWITATWTTDGRKVSALVHHEYQANTHSGRCASKVYIECWYNTIVAVSSVDGGRTFQRPAPPVVVASAPFRQEVGQGRHRGFFNPSNIVSDGRFHYVLVSTTGWAGQAVGACLFRTADPADPSSWRAHDGSRFSIGYADPYRAEPDARPCRTVAPFPAPVGAVVRHRPSGAWVAVFQASGSADPFPVPGFYTTSSRDLLHWDRPRLLLGGLTLYDLGAGCPAAPELIAYPSLIDRTAEGRNFDDTGRSAELYYSVLRVEGCQVKADRRLERRRVTIDVLP